MTKLNRNIWILYGISLLQGMVFYGPIATLYRQAAGVSFFQITIIESISLALCLLLELPWGLVADRIGYKKTMLICCSLYFVSKIIFWKAEGFDAFLAERILLSVVMSGISGVDTSILYCSCERGKAQQIFGHYNNLGTAGLLFASGVYSIIIKDQYRMAGLLTAVSYGFAAVLAFGLVEVKDIQDAAHTTEEEAFISLLSRILRNKYHLLFLIGVALLNETHQTFTVFLNQLQYVKCGLSNAAIGSVYIGITLVGLLGVFSDKLTKRLGELQTLFLLYGSAIAACIVLGFTDGAALSVLSIAVLRISFSLFQPLQTELQNRQVFTQNRATELSVNAVIINSIGIGTNLIYGRLGNRNVAQAMLAGAALCFVGLVFVIMWWLRHQKSIE